MMNRERGRGHYQANRGGGSDRGSSGDRGRGRGRGKWITDKDVSAISARRNTSIQLGSEATDDLLVAPMLDADAQHKAHFFLSRKNFDGFRSQQQLQEFIHSLLVNLSNHHAVDVSGLLTELASKNGRAILRDIMLGPISVDASSERILMSFQYVILPLVGVLTRENVCLSSLVDYLGPIYAEVYVNRSRFLDEGIIPCMRELIDRGSMDDTNLLGPQLCHSQSLLQVPSLQHAMLAIIRLVYQLVKRIQDAKVQMRGTVITLRALATECIARSDESGLSRFLNQHLEKESQRLQSMVSASPMSIISPGTGAMLRRYTSQGPNLVHLTLNYDPPGALSKNGPRHNNDHALIKDIQIVPTHEELISDRLPFLPSNDVPGAPHFLQPGWARLLDTHFRLNREDLIRQLRLDVSAFLNALRITPRNQWGMLLSRKDLRRVLGQDVGVNVYANVEFFGTNTERHLQGSIKIAFDQPQQIKGKPKSEREIFWQRSRKRLMQGSIVCFIFPAEEEEDADRRTTTRHGSNAYVCIGVVNSRDDGEMAKDDERAVLHINLTDPDDYRRFVNARKAKKGNSSIFMIESLGGFFEAYRPVLRALQTCEPASMPFEKYIAAIDDRQPVVTTAMVDPPLYARAPNFEFDLSVLLKRPAVCRLDVEDPFSHRQAVEALRTHTTLDGTQSQALVDALTREVALIRGPPGTGKTKIGVDIMRVLLHNEAKMNCGPILCICFTNHALDQFLEHLLDQGITHLVRIGSRSQSERLHNYGLRELLKAQDKPYAVRSALAHAYNEWDVAEKQLKEVERKLLQGQPPRDAILRCIEDDNRILYYNILNGDGRGRGDEDRAYNYERWTTGADLRELEKENELLRKRGTREPNSNVYELLVRQTASAVYNIIPNTNRPLGVLRDANPWKMSIQERKRLLAHWSEQVEEELRHRYTTLMEEIRRLSQTVNDAHDEIRRTILRQAKVVGMTTNGAAKFQSIVAALSPRIIICEEAGEVLEAHILAALSGSTQHLILIGDHLQLRPQIMTHALSSDSEQGRQYNLDRSLFERLVASVKMPSSLLTTQRRMRPEICDLVRHSLYPQLIDGENVITYPSVRGMAKNLFFMDHRNPEDNRDQYGIQSFANTFEVEMVQGLVQHLIRNGHHRSNIAVLTPYLGQFSRLRDKLSEFTRLAIDERDQEQLDAFEDIFFAKKDEKKTPLDRPLTLRTIDNYQGEEADIIIISLVRSDTRDEGHGSSPTIGFLKSPNRTNVLLSRARHGMYLIGNAPLMEQSKKNGIWPEVIRELRETGRIGQGFPLRCPKHPEAETLVTTPEEFGIHSPNGGCNRPCNECLPCGHLCRMMCHLSDSEHKISKCTEPCPRLHPDCNHVCPKQCGQPCGECKEVIEGLDLPCGHRLSKAYCFQSKNISKIRCKVQVDRQLPHCEHTHAMDCSQDLDAVKCPEACDVVLDCGHLCSRQCHKCQEASARESRQPTGMGVVRRIVHGPCRKKCDKQLHCGHACNDFCHPGVECPPCRQSCTAACPHAKCILPCEELCAACCEPCTWKCTHQGSCRLPCGAPCSRLPCNQRCDKLLLCGHQCPSVCGEKCPPKKYCVECKSDPGVMEMIVDVIMQATLSDVDVNEDPLLVLSCGHALTMSSLDGLMEMTEYYEGDMDLTTGAVTFVKTKELPAREVAMVGCPTCRAPIASLFRYGRRIKHSQLIMRLKKFEMRQNKQIVDAEERLQAAEQGIMKALPGFLDALAKFKSLPCPEPPRGSSSTLGHFENQADLFPNSDVKSLFYSYGIHHGQDVAWVKLIQPAIECIQAFDKIRTAAATSPARRLYEASVAHVYRFKSEVFYVDSVESGYRTVLWTLQEPKSLLEECARECGLSPDGQAGSSLVRGIQGRTNTLMLVLHIAFQAIDKGSSSGIETGWYWFVRDLLQCCENHCKVQHDVASKGNHARIEMYANMNLLDIYYKRMQWLSRRPYNSNIADKQRIRQNAVDEILEPFMATLWQIRDSSHIGLRTECLPKAKTVESRMVTATKVALSQLHQPLTQDEKFEVFRAVQESLSGSGHWYRCPNGHSYVIADCGMAMQESNCPECGARIGGRSHQLQADNQVDVEYEGLHHLHHS